MPNETKKRPLITSSLVPVTGRGLSAFDLRSLVQNEPENFLRKLEEGAKAGKLKIQDVQDWRSLYGALAGETLSVTMKDFAGYQRTIQTSAFPILTGTLGIYAINDSYLDYPAMGQELVTEFDDPKKVTSMVAIHNQDSNKDEVKELEKLPLVFSKEEKTEVRHRKNGRRIEISMEMISESQGYNVVSQFNALGNIMADWVEELTLERVTDHTGSGTSPAEPYVYRPGGTGTALFSATANTPGTRAPSGNRVTTNAFVDDSDLETFRVRLRTMKNERGKRINIPWSRVKLLVPDTIIGNVLKTFNSEYVPGVENELSNWGPRGQFHIPPPRVISTPKMDDLSAAAWYGGDFQSQFKRKWKIRNLYVTLGQETQAYLTNHVAFQASLAWDVEVGAIDYVYVIQNLAATTAPVDE